MSQQLNNLSDIAKNAAPNSFAAMFAESISRQEMRAGEVITAEVLRIDQNHVVVNAGLKSESFIPLEEFLNDQGVLDVKEGDFVSVAIEALEDGRGETRLSRDRAKRLAAWVSLEQALESGETVIGTVTGKVKGEPYTKVFNIKDVLADPQVQHRQSVMRIEDPDLGSIPAPCVVPRISGASTKTHRSGPAVGEHNVDFFGELGLSLSDLERLKAKGVL